MLKQIAFISVLFFPVLWLSSCSTPSKKIETVEKVMTDPKSSAAEKQAILLELEDAIRDAKKRQAWPDYIQLSQSLWQKVGPSDQLAIEYQVWSTLKQLPPKTLAQLQAQAETDQNIEMLDWLALVEATQQRPIWQKQSLRDLAEFNTGAFYNEHLLAQLQTRLEHPVPVKHVAVLLPFSGQYANISEQIRDGILKNHFAHQRDTIIRFYDSSDLNNLQQTYLNAVHQGAEWVIGPLTKEAVETLAALKPNNLIALNHVDQSQVKQFNFKSESEAFQINQKLQYNNMKRIGILTSTANSDAALASQIAGDWKQTKGHVAVLKSYPTKNPNLRKALGSVINETNSQARKNNLYWLFREKIEFTPRTRQDLDAIVLVGNTRRLGVFKPQFKFFELDLPIYGTSKITPAQLDKTPANRDLSDLIFPTMPAALKPTPLNTPFEAFGWDSLTIVMNQDNLAPGVCLNNGMTGRLSIQENEIDHDYVWGKYSSAGLAEKAPDIRPSDSQETTPETPPQETGSDTLETAQN